MSRKTKSPARDGLLESLTQHARNDSDAQIALALLTLRDPGAGNYAHVHAWTDVVQSLLDRQRDDSGYVRSNPYKSVYSTYLVNSSRLLSRVSAALYAAQRRLEAAA